MAPRDSRVVMGENDVIHTAMGWSDLHHGADGVAFRRSSPVGDIYLIGGESVHQATASLRNGKGEARAWHDNAGDLKLLGSIAFDAPAGSWTTVTIPISAEYEASNPIHIRLDTAAGVDVATCAAS